MTTNTQQNHSAMLTSLLVNFKTFLIAQTPAAQESIISTTLDGIESPTADELKAFLQKGAFTAEQVTDVTTNIVITYVDGGIDLWINSTLLIGRLGLAMAEHQAKLLAISQAEVNKATTKRQGSSPAFAKRTGPVFD